MRDKLQIGNVRLWGGITIAFFLLTLIAGYWALGKNEVESGIYRILVRNSSSAGHGTGFKVAEPGIIVTNYHVVRGAEAIRVAYIDGRSGSALSARILWFNSDKDLAIIKTEDSIPGRVMELADIREEELNKTDEVTAVGFPGIVDRVSAEIEQGYLDKKSISRILLDSTFSSGTIQRLIPSIQRLIIQHSATVNAGNSGGPLFDACQRVIGVNTLSATTTLDLQEIARALTNRTKLRIDNPGDLEFAVHIQEVLKALQEKNISYASTPGTCWGSTDFYERTTLGLSLLAMLGSLAICAVGFAGPRNRRYEPVGGLGFEQIEDLTYIERVDAGSNDNSPTLISEFDASEYELSDYGDLENGNGIVIGRTKNDADLIIKDSSVSRKHAQIFKRDSKYMLQDIGSTNGTFVDGKQLPSGSECTLFNGASLKFGSVDLVFSEIIRSNASTLQGDGNWLLSGFDQNGNTLQFTLRKSSPSAMSHSMDIICKIGRSQSCDFTVVDDSVSREHAVIGATHSGQLAIVDLGSSNGTYVDGRQVGAEPIPIKPSQKIILGSTELYLSK